RSASCSSAAGQPGEANRAAGVRGLDSLFPSRYRQRPSRPIIGERISFGPLLPGLSGAGARMACKPWWAVALLGLSRCVMTGGFTRAMLESRLHEDTAKVTDEDIKEIQTLKPQLHFPCRIAVALQAGSGYWRWTPKDRQAMEAWADELCKDGIASDVIFM